jgi:enoyl-CoA hydratase/carnithine racemase
MPIRSDVDGHVVTIVIDRPEARNALDPEHNEALAAAFEEFAADPSLRVAILTASGETFSAGADLKALIPPYRAAVERGESPAWTFGGITAANGVGKPLIAAINGHALAGGLELALACDIRIAVPEATLGLAETKWALIPGAGGTQRLPRTVPLGAALELILTGEPIDAAEAHRIGLVNRVVPADALPRAAAELAATIARRGPLAVTAAKQAVHGGPSLDLAAGMELEHALFLDVMGTEDAVEGPRAFAEKRQPVYRGR